MRQHSNLDEVLDGDLETKTEDDFLAALEEAEERWGDDCEKLHEARDQILEAGLRAAGWTRLAKASRSLERQGGFWYA